MNGYTCVVCIKQVPDTKKVTGQAMKADGTINRAALPAIFNPEDKNALEAALSEFDGTIITVSHDRYFIDKLASRILALKPGDVFGKDLLDYPSEKNEGVYTEYIRYKEAREAEMAAASGGDSGAATTVTASVSKEQYLQAKKSSSDARREQKRIEKMKTEAEKLEKEIDEVTSELYGAAATDYIRAAELESLREEKETRLLEIYEEIGV